MPPALNRPKVVSPRDCDGVGQARRHHEAEGSGDAGAARRRIGDVELGGAAEGTPRLLLTRSTVRRSDFYLAGGRAAGADGHRLGDRGCADGAGEQQRLAGAWSSRLVDVPAAPLVKAEIGEDLGGRRGVDGEVDRRVGGSQLQVAAVIGRLNLKAGTADAVADDVVDLRSEWSRQCRSRRGCRV